MDWTSDIGQRVLTAKHCLRHLQNYDATDEEKRAIERVKNILTNLGEELERSRNHVNNLQDS